MAKYRTIAGIEHVVYDSMEEFKKSNPDGLVNLDWRKGREGDWVLADDDSIMQVLKYGKVSSDNPREYIRTAAGTSIIWDKGRLDSNFKECIYSFGGKLTRHTNLSLREKAFVVFILLGLDPLAAYLRAFKATNEYRARLRAYILLAKGEIVEAIRKGIEEAGESSGATLEWAMKSIKGTVEGSKSDSIKLRGAGMIADLHAGEKNSSPADGLLSGFRGFGAEALPEGDTKQIGPPS